MNDLSGIYFLQSENTNTVKIGKTACLDNRIRGIMGNSPNPLILIGFINTTNIHEYERKLHEKYYKYRIFGEWFSLPEDIINEIKTKYDHECCMYINNILYNFYENISTPIIQQTVIKEVYDYIQEYTSTTIYDITRDLVLYISKANMLVNKLENDGLICIKDDRIYAI